MSVLVTALSVIVKNEVLEDFYPGGVKGYGDDCPNRTFRTDGFISCISFMMPRDVLRFIDKLEKRGFIFKVQGKSRDIAVADEQTGISPPCDWLILGTTEDGLVHCWLADREPGKLSLPEGWTEQTKVTRIDPEELDKKFRYLRTENNVDVYEEIATGKIKYVGRTSTGRDHELLAEKLAAIGQRLVSLDKKIEDARRNDDGGLDLELEKALRDLLKQAKEVEVKEGPIEALSCHVIGLALRYLGCWAEAEREFRRLTVLKPDYIGGWLELTWCLSEQKKHEEEEWASGKAVEVDPESAAAWGNRTLALIHLRREDAAREAIEKALVLNPDDWKNRYIFDNFEKFMTEAEEAFQLSQTKPS